MNNWRGLITFLLGCAIIYLFWPFLVWMILLIAVMVGFWAFRFWWMVHKTKQQLNEQEYHQEAAEEADNDYPRWSSESQNSDIIDAEYTERRIDDEQR